MTAIFRLCLFTGATIVLERLESLPGVAMTYEVNGRESGATVPVIDLSKAPGERAAWDKPRAVIFLWSAMELIFVTNPWQISSSLRVKVLRMFGANIGAGVIFRPRTRIKFPWKLHIGDRAWIGEGVWFHNQDHVYIGSDVVISQETFVTTGSHSHRTDMGLLTSPVHIGDGSWVTSRCMVLGGAVIGKSCLISPMTVVRGKIEDNQIVSGNPAVPTGRRFDV